jgi:hypothetical protein
VVILRAFLGLVTERIAHRDFKSGKPFARQLRLSAGRQAPEPVTTVIGLKHKEGMLLFTDTFETTFHRKYYAKNLSPQHIQLRSA